MRQWELGSARPTASEVASWSAPPDQRDRETRLVASGTDVLDLREHLKGVAGDECLLLRCRLHCGEAMRLEALLGCDGPLRMWIGDTELAWDPHGTRRPVPDSLCTRFDAAPGAPVITIALGARGDQATSVCLRFERLDLSWELLLAGPSVYQLPSLGHPQ